MQRILNISITCIFVITDGFIYLFNYLFNVRKSPKCVLIPDYIGLKKNQRNLSGGLQFSIKGTIGGRSIVLFVGFIFL